MKTFLIAQARRSFKHRFVKPLSSYFSIGAVVAIQGVPYAGNLLQNADFQSDWLTLSPQSRTLTWCFIPDYFNRRDYNPDAWQCSGNWAWEQADALPGERRLMLQGLNTEIRQSVNWALIFDDHVLPPNSQIADDGGFPLAQTVISERPLSMVRDVTLTVRFRGTGVPANAGRMEVMFDSVASTVSASVPWPSGTYDWRTMSVTLPAEQWLSQTPSAGGAARVLPMFARARLIYNNSQGSIELGHASLSEPGPDGPNLLANGSFESLDENDYPVGWSQPEKYLRFPLKLFYLFQTWHNALSDNRGPVISDDTVSRSGARSLKMIMPSGDEKMITSDPIQLNQQENRLIEVSAWVKTDRMAMLHVGALDQDDQPIPGYSIIQKANVTGTPANIYEYTSPFQFTIVSDNDWVLLRQVFRSTAPLQSIRLQLCARGVNGYTLDDAGEQPQNHVTGTVWWDDVRVYEPESTMVELASRGVQRAFNPQGLPGVQLHGLDMGERMPGLNRLQATVSNPGPTQSLRLRWRFESPTGVISSFESDEQTVVSGARVPFTLFYDISEGTPAYSEYKATLEVINYAGVPLAVNELWFSTWTTPIDIQLGALYAPPDYTNQYVRMNLGLSSLSLESMQKVRLEILRRHTEELVHVQEHDVNLQTLENRRDRIPIEVYDDFRALVLKDLDISMLPVQPFDEPERQWFVRVKALDGNTNVLVQADSPPFCRQAHDGPQPGIEQVTITTNNLLFVNGEPWMPWGRIYDNIPTYNGPAEGVSGFRDLQNMPRWINPYGWRWGLNTNSRAEDDFNVKRYYRRVQTPQLTLINDWVNDNIQCATAFAFGYQVYTMSGMFARMGGEANANAYLDWAATAPMVVSLGPGIEEVFSEFAIRTPQELDGLRQITEYLRDRSGKPIMVGHGGYWNRFEFEKVPFFDIYDPETEPLFPANLHTDLQPLIRGEAKTIWLRPQLYEHVPYERWRFHTYVEMMRGCRGWQMAHGPGDLSLFRGLHGELRYLTPMAFSSDMGPEVAIVPDMEHMVRRVDDTTFIMAATTRGLAVGRYRWDDDVPSPVGRSRRTTGRSEARNEDLSYVMGHETLFTGPTLHGMNNMPDSRSWPDNSVLKQWFKLDADAPPSHMAFVVKVDGRWTHGAYWGDLDPDFSSTPQRQEWFIRMLYKQAAGFAIAGGWGALLYEENKQYTMTNGVYMGDMPSAGEWHLMTLPLSDLGISTQMVDGVAMIHDESGTVWWSHTTLEDPQGHSSTLFGNAETHPPHQLENTRLYVEGLTNGTPVRVLFEDRSIIARDGYFEDDFRGEDLYQRFGGDFGLGYGAAPVALHIYEIEGL